MSGLESQRVSRKFKISKSEPKEFELRIKPLVLPSERRKEAISQFDSERDSSNDLSVALPTDELLELSWKAILSNDYHMALGFLQQSLVQSPQDPRAIRGMAQCLRSTGQLDEALKCNRALQGERRKASDEFLLAEIEAERGEFDNALSAYFACLERIHSEGSLLFEVYKGMGNVYVRIGDYESAQENYNRAYALDPDSDVLMVNYGTLELQKDNFEDGLKCFRRAVDINSENEKAWIGLALIHREYGDRELAWANLERALDIDSTHCTAINLAFEWGVKDGRISQLINRLEEALNQSTADEDLSLLMARTLIIGRRYGQARIELERLLSLQPTHPEGLDLYEEISALEQKKDLNVND